MGKSMEEKRKKWRGQETSTTVGRGGGRGRGESEKYEAIMGEKRVLLLNLSRVVFTFSS